MGSPVGRPDSKSNADRGVFCIAGRYGSDSLIRMIIPRFIGGCLLTALLSLSGQAISVPEEMAAAAHQFLVTLDPEQKATATFEFADPERLNWHFIPRERKGLSWKAMNPAQQRLAFALLSTALSSRGFGKVTTIMSLEQILREIEKGKGPLRDEERYYLSIFNEPSTGSTWGWRVEGHHLSLNVTLVDGTHVVVTPSFLGTNPAEVREGSRAGLRVLAAEEDLGRELIKSLTAAQRAQALLPQAAPKDVLLTPGKRVTRLKPEGIAADQLQPEQKELLRFLVSEYLRNYRPALADLDWHRIESNGWNQVYFAWAGDLERGAPHYYRVQGPTFVLEYDNTQNDANHVHALWRDATNDFGEDLLRQHLEAVPHNGTNQE